jgi:PAS domain S-box-containing protein
VREENVVNPQPEQKLYKPACAVDATQRLELAMAAARLGEWSWDARRDRFTLNRRASAILGLPSSDDTTLSGQNLRSLFHPEDRARAEVEIGLALSSRSGYRVEYRVNRARGGTAWVAMMGQALYDELGAVTGMIGVVQDVTEWRLREEALRETNSLLERERAAHAEADRVSAQKDEFLAIVAHELRSPLGAILGWAHMLRRRGSQEEFERGLDVIEQSVQLQNQLIEDLVDLSRITSGRMRLEIQPLEARAFIDAAVETVRPAAEAKGVQIRKVLDLAVPPVAGDATRLQQVMVNLLSNAVKFTLAEGTIEVLLRRQGDRAEISVRDNGIGIAPDFLPHVFDRFRQGKAAAVSGQVGLGLGLAIARQLVQMHGGEVSAASPGEGRGATFTLRLPLAPVGSAPT